MLSKIKNIFLSSSSVTNNVGSVTCADCDCSDNECIEYLSKNNCIENISDIDTTSRRLQTIIFSEYHLEGIGFYYSFERFIQKNKYRLSNSPFYIRNINCSDIKQTSEYTNYCAIIKLIDAIKSISLYTYQEAGDDKSIIYKEDTAVLIPFIYSFQDAKSLTNSDKIADVCGLLLNDNSEHKHLYINELIIFLKEEKEDNRFKHLITNFSDYYEKSQNAYCYYLRDFSFNKQKMEIDSRALDYIQRIQSIINDSQTKLIAIPAAFILAVSSFDFNNIDETQNTAIVVGSILFSAIIQVFLNNQFSSLKYINNSITSYKESFPATDITSISESFKLVESERKKQRKRLIFVNIILWVIPIALLVVWLLLLYQN